MIKKLLNTIASDGGDITLDKQVLTVATLPPIDFDNIDRSTEVLVSLAETRQILSVAYTAANNTEYKFTVNQIIDGKLYTKIVKYTSDASGSDAEIATGLVGAFNNAKNGVRAVASGAATPLTFTAAAKYDSDYVIVGEPMLSIEDISNTTTTSNQDNHTAALQGGSITDATPCVVTAVAHGLVSGQKITLAGITTATTLNATWRATVLTANTYELDGSTDGTGAAGVGAATAIEVAQASRGHIGDLVNDSITSSDITANTAYSRVDFTYSIDKHSDTGSKGEISGLKTRLYISAHSTTAPGYTATSNYANFEKRLTERLKGVVAADFVMFVGYKDLLYTPAGTWTNTRVAQGNFVYRKIATDEACILATDITAALQTAASKGFKLNSFDIIYGVGTDALDTAATLTLDRIEYADTVAVSVNSIAVTGIPEAGFQATPFVTNIVVDSPIFNITDDSKYVVEANFDAGTNTILDWYGIMLKFTKTEVDYEALSRI
ncbi:hypothetical protein LCGC14_1653920 [marine sediment metagenome]|uniref:Uncharacterized protein n=1 Tax=marine sediment metagenome TaxID=412755 RepID=A0A0F9KWB5_9ZZZZ